MSLKKGLNVLKKLKMMIIQKIFRGYIFNFKAKETINQAYNEEAKFYMYKPDNFEKLKLLLNKMVSLEANSLIERPDRDNFVTSV